MDDSQITVSQIQPPILLCGAGTAATYIKLNIFPMLTIVNIQCIMSVPALYFLLF